MNRSPATPRPVVLEPCFRRYAWGDRESITRLLRLPPSDDPVAEAWYGGHPTGSATVSLPGGEAPLGTFLADAGEAFLGVPQHSEASGLPYLLKIIAAARPLSIQAHPNVAQAQEGFAREEAAGIARDDFVRCFKDESDKPEILVALTDFEALCGFRSPRDIAATLDELPELRALLPPLAPTDDGLRELLRAYFGLPDASWRPALERAVVRVEERGEGRGIGEAQARAFSLAHRELSTADGPDRGLFLVLLLEHLRLEPGQALFVPAGVPHAYLGGMGVELMACSDNVLRAGLTTKHVAPDDLLDLLRFDARRPPILEPAYDESGRHALFPSASSRIALERYEIGPGHRAERVANGAETVLALPEFADVTVRVVHDEATVALRRGEACLVPHGAHYALEADAEASVIVAGAPGDERARTFRGSRPTCLTFGTSGLRGLVDDITDLEAYVNTRGFLDHLVESGDAVPGTVVAIGGDLRPSTSRILEAVSRACADAGLRVAHCGRLPTPALTYYGVRRGIPSIVVTGSHIPFDRNGIKFNKSTGEVLKSDEIPILGAVERARRIEYHRARRASRFDDAGRLRPSVPPALPTEPDDAARATYVARYTETFSPDALAGLRLALYEHSAVGRDLLAEILTELGAEVHPVGRAESFVAIDTEAISAEALADLQTLADETSARVGPLDAIVSTDGDSDRPLVVGLDAEGRARFVRGDVLGAIVADYLEADAIAVPVSANDAIDRHFAPRGVPVVRTRIGSPWVIAAMERLEGERRVGWEANGGFLVGSAIPLGDGRLEPLPTRDAVLPILAVLGAARCAGVRVPELLANMPSRFADAGLLDGVAPEDSGPLTVRFGTGDPALRRVAFGNGAPRAFAMDGRELTPSPTQARHLESVGRAIERVFDAAHGFGELEELDALDGLRFRFRGGDVAHVRPSGNAPQLRIYAVADTEARAREIVALGLAEPDGLLRTMLREAAEARYVDAIRRNIDAADELFEHGTPPAVIGTVCGSEAAQAFWQTRLDRARDEWTARVALSLHEDLPVNQAFGLLLAWQRLRPHLEEGEGALLAFVFGEGTRATPLTEAESGQKPALASFVTTRGPHGSRRLSIVELAMRTFAPVEAHLRRSGFDGIVVKWGDEVQIPTRDLRGADPLFREADVVRFVSMRAMNPDTAANKDWVGVDDAGRVTAFVPRRPIEEMENLADRGVLQRRGGTLYGGINLGSIAISRALLDALLDEFAADVNDPGADRRRRPDLDPQLFTALTIATIDSSRERERAWVVAQEENPAIRKLASDVPDVLARLRAALERLEARHGRPTRIVAMDFGEVFWGDVGQHRQLHAFYSALRDSGPDGRIARALAGVADLEPDERGNLLVGATELGAQVDVRDSVLVDARIDAGHVHESVLVGTRCGSLHAESAFDVESTALEMRLAERAGTYKVIAHDPVVAEPGERLATVFLPDAELLMRVHEDTDLRDRATNYDAPILGNAISFREAHERVVAADPRSVEMRRTARRRDVVSRLDEDAAT